MDSSAGEKRRGCCSQPWHKLPCASVMKGFNHSSREANLKVISDVSRRGMSSSKCIPSPPRLSGVFCAANCLGQPIIQASLFLNLIFVFGMAMLIG